MSKSACHRSASLLTRRQLQQERPINASSPAYREWLQRSTKFHRRQDADTDRFFRTWQTGYRGPAAWDEEPEPRPQPTPEPTPQPTPQPEETATAQRKRRQAEVARDRRKRQRPTNVAEIIRDKCEPCTIEEASSVEVARKALKAAGCNQTDLNANGLSSSNRRQKGTSRGRAYYFVFKFEEELQPMRVR